MRERFQNNVSLPYIITPSFLSVTWILLSGFTNRSMIVDTSSSLLIIFRFTEQIYNSFSD
ncbi:unnamed protein product [Sphenostylis stenocarpa]|uniref:Uncharacterized protein n=1 Tax=Sphenostylis stenocarpa TaxID=92480 RepID=A0AA86TAY3_9FABA|nr:unnamed protein product [Sphenostylis stenocarpa]